MTKILMGVLAAIYVIDLLPPGGLVSSYALLSNVLVYSGEFWRLVTFGVTTYGLLHLLMSLLVLWIAGRAMENVLGSWRFLALYLLSGLGGGTLLFIFGPFNLVAAGASASVIGLLAANGVIKYRRKEDVRADVGLLILLVLYSFVVGFGGYVWISQVGGILVGALTGFVLAFAPRSRRLVYQVVGLAAVFILCCAAVAFRLTT